MKGIIFSLFEGFVIDTYGHDVLDELYGAAPEVDDTMVAVKTYPDEWMYKLVGVACGRLDLDARTALRAFGRYALHKLVRQYPVFLEGHSHPKSFLASVNDVIHVEVHKLMPDAQTATILCTDMGGEDMHMTYQSERGLCALAEGLLEGTAEHFGYGVSFEHASCTHRGDPQCGWDIVFNERSG